MFIVEGEGGYWVSLIDHLKHKSYLKNKSIHKDERELKIMSTWLMDDLYGSKFFV